MKILFIGDISGKPGRLTVKEVLPEIRAEHNPDIVIANCENAAHGLGITRKVVTELASYGIDYFTGGDHIWHVKAFVNELNDLSIPIVRPYNYDHEEELPGKGFATIDLGSKGKLIVVNLLGQSFMRNLPANPFWAVDKLFAQLGLDAEGKNEQGEKQTIIVDFHAESTAEKLCMADYLKNRVSALVGTHTHVPTADERTMGDMAYVTDVGMVGPLNASLWIEFETAIHNFKYPYKMLPKMEENGPRIFNAVLIEVENGKALKISRIDKKIN